MPKTDKHYSAPVINSVSYPCWGRQYEYEDGECISCDAKESCREKVGLILVDRNDLIALKKRIDRLIG